MTLETIYASVTKNQKSAISIIRVTGSQTKRICKLFFKKVIEEKKANIRNIYTPKGEFIDQGIILLFLKPRSPTGEDTIEFHVHGSFSILTKIEKELDKIKGVREAHPGEFTKRAFYNQKLDLIQVEGLEDLLDASTELQRIQAQFSFMGSVSLQISKWRLNLIELSALIESTIDFSDETLPDETISLFYKKLDNLIKKITKSIHNAKYSKKIREGIKVVVTGPPNAGKSSLINCLLSENLSIVSEVPGTTRDIVSSSIDFDGALVSFYDTAGIHKTRNEIEAEGIRRAKELIEISDIQIRVVDGSEKDWKAMLNSIPGDNEQKIDLINKSDISNQTPFINGNTLNISIKTKYNIEKFKKLLSEKIKSVVNKADNPIIIRERHIKTTNMILECLIRIRSCDIISSPEIVSEEIRHSLNLIGKIAGTVGVEEILDNLFKSFCIGK